MKYHLIRRGELIIEKVSPARWRKLYDPEIPDDKRRVLEAAKANVIRDARARGLL